MRTIRSDLFAATPSPVTADVASQLRLLWAAEVAATENVPHLAFEEVRGSLLIAGTDFTTGRRQQYALFCEVAGPALLPVFDPSWRTDTAVLLARQMYESRDFGAMPILADALQDAGCDSDDILNHCRDAKQTHVRGCWVIDLVLGKS